MSYINALTLPNGTEYDLYSSYAAAAGSVAYGTCSTVAATAEKVVTIQGDYTSNWSLQVGAIIGVKFTYTNTASNVTLNVNSTGAKSIYYSGSVYTSTWNLITGYANRILYYMYDGTYWVYISDGSVNIDKNLTQTATTTDADYEVLFSNTADNTTRTEQARKNSNLLFNPSTGNLQTTQLNGVTIGSSPKFTDTTYTAGTNITIADGVISATSGTTYTAGDNIDITDSTISVTGLGGAAFMDADYYLRDVTAGTGIDVSTTSTTGIKSIGIASGYKMTSSWETVLAQTTVSKGTTPSGTTSLSNGFSTAKQKSWITFMIMKSGSSIVLGEITIPQYLINNGWVTQVQVPFSTGYYATFSGLSDEGTTVILISPYQDVKMWIIRESMWISTSTLTTE